MFQHAQDKLRNRSRGWRRIVITSTLALVMGSANAADAPLPDDLQYAISSPDRLVSSGLDEQGRLNLLVNRSVVLQTRTPYKRMSVAQPEVADINAVGPRSVLVTAKRAGSTQMVFWDDQERSQVVDVAVDIDLEVLKQAIARVLPDSKVDVASVGGSVVLKGQVPSLQAAEQVVAIATPFATRVVNLLEVAGGQQVMLQVRFAEVSRSATSQLGVNFGMSDGVGFGATNIGQVNPFKFSTGSGFNVPDTSASVTLFGGGEIGRVSFQGFINALRQNNLMRILAEPNLIAISGQEASFLAGGEFPIPVSQDSSQGGGGITIEYREFGVRLKFVPVVLGNGKIRLKVAPEVSDLDFTTAVRVSGFVVPGLSTRKVNTTIELGEGQTFAIAGLLNNTITATKDSLPLLGDVPVLGSLFRSVRYQRKETELLVLVTPLLVEGMNPGQTPKAPGQQWRNPDEMQLFLMGDLGGERVDVRHAPARTENAEGQPRLFQGQYGFAPVDASGTPRRGAAARPTAAAAQPAAKVDAPAATPVAPATSAEPTKAIEPTQAPEAATPAARDTQASADADEMIDLDDMADGFDGFADDEAKADTK